MNDAKIAKRDGQPEAHMTTWDGYGKKILEVDRVRKSIKPDPTSMANSNKRKHRRNSKVQEPMSKEHKAPRDIIGDNDGSNDDIPDSIPVTGEEWWMKYLGLTEALPWPQEEVNNDDTSQTY